MLDVRLPCHRQRDDERVQREDVEQAEHPVLVQQHEADEHQPAGEQMGHVQCEAVHHTLCETNRSSAASRPSMSAAPRKSETRKTRIFAVTVSKTASRNPPTASLAR